MDGDQFDEQLNMPANSSEEIMFFRGSMARRLPKKLLSARMFGVKR